MTASDNATFDPSSLVPIVFYGAGQRGYDCAVVIVSEGNGGFYAYAPRLPGAASQGDTVEDAIRNITEALSGAITEYLEDDGTIPWTDEDENAELPVGALRFQLLIHVG